MSQLNIVTIAGNRPEVIKLSKIVKDLDCRYEHAFVYTGQHYSENMKDVFFEELNVQPDIDLKLSTSNISVLTKSVSNFFSRKSPTHVIVYGDTNSTVAGALAAKKVFNCKIIHIEAGLRSFDLQMPEEKNRILVDSISDHLLAPTDLSKLFLKYEDKLKNVVVTGNPIVDICRKFYYMTRMPKLDLPDEFVLLTIHRSENVDNPYILKLLMKCLLQIKHKVVFPIHPRTRKNLLRFDINVPSNVLMIDPLSYLEFLALVKKTLLVLTDSGGLQEECIILKKPCITLRHTTERWETLLLKANVLFPISKNMTDSLDHVIEKMLNVNIRKNPYGENVHTKIMKRIQAIVEG